MRYYRVLAGTTTLALASLLVACGPNSASQPPSETVTVTESAQSEAAATTDASTAATSPAAENTGGAGQAGNEISAEEAFGIAFAHAGVSADAVSDRESELEEDDGRRIWEIEFSANGMDYDYDIDAVTKEIIHVDNDRDDG